MSEDMVYVSREWKNRIDFSIKVLGLFDGFDWLSNDDLLWRIGDEFNVVTFYVNCNDLFYWGCADVEDITPANIHLLGEAVKKLSDVGIVAANDKYKYLEWATSLFACMSRGLRPQNCILRNMRKRGDEALALLFESCGPERSEASCG